MASRLIKEKEQEKLQDKYMEVDRETGKLVLGEDVDVSLVELDDIVDSQGNKRFIEGAGVSNSKITNVYCRWSLSATHLLIVLGGSIVDGTSLNNGETLATYNIPSWIARKIVPLFSNSIERKGVYLWTPDYQQISMLMWLQTIENTLKITSGAPYTISGDKTFRVEFDLLIDTDE